jgi:hypothetical protein
MKENYNSKKLTEAYPILLSLPKKCVCHVCTEAKAQLKSQIGEKDFRRVCQLLKIHN